MPDATVYFEGWGYPGWGEGGWGEGDFDVALTASVGSVTPKASATTEITGFGITTSVGSGYVVTAGAGILAGSLNARVRTSSVDVIAEAGVNLTGALITSAYGSVEVFLDIHIEATGLQANTAFNGVADISGGAVIPVTGEEIESYIGHAYTFVWERDVPSETDWTPETVPGSPDWTPVNPAQGTWTPTSPPPSSPWTRRTRPTNTWTQKG